MTTTHPLDPLTADELRLAVQIARSDTRFAGAAFPSVAVADPSKVDVLAWQPGQRFARQARVQVMTADGFFELLVDLTGRRIVSALEPRGVEPSITLSKSKAPGWCCRMRSSRQDYSGAASPI